MANFQNEAEVNKYIGGIFETAIADSEVGPKLLATGMTLRMDFNDPDAVVTVDLGNGKVLLGEAAKINTDATLTMSSETANSYWQGKVSLPLAMAKGKVKVGGSAAHLLKLAPVAKSLYPAYVERLKADGRDDLIV